MKTARKKAFTLIELLVVIALISFLAVAIGKALQSPEAGVGLSTAQRIAASLVQATRSQAVLKRTRARLLINANPAGDDKRHRYFGVVYEARGRSNSWLAANDGIYLPRGIYFDVANSTQYEAGGGWNIPFPRSGAVSAGDPGSDTWYYYEFASNGICRNAGARFVLAVGHVNGPDGSVRLSPDQLGGFIIHRLGSISFARNPDDLRD